MSAENRCLETRATTISNGGVDAETDACAWHAAPSCCHKSADSDWGCRCPCRCLHWPWANMNWCACVVVVWATTASWTATSWTRPDWAISWRHSTPSRCSEAALTCCCYCWTKWWWWRRSWRSTRSICWIWRPQSPRQVRRTSDGIGRCATWLSGPRPPSKTSRCRCFHGRTRPPSIQAWKRAVCHSEHRNVLRSKIKCVEAFKLDLC